METGIDKTTVAVYVGVAFVAGVGVGYLLKGLLTKEEPKQGAILSKAA